MKAKIESAETYLDKSFPKDKSKLRGEAMVLIALAKIEERNRIQKVINNFNLDEATKFKLKEEINDW